MQSMFCLVRHFVYDLRINLTQFLVHRIDKKYSGTILILQFFDWTRVFRKKPSACFIREGPGKPERLHFSCSEIVFCHYHGEKQQQHLEKSL